MSQKSYNWNTIQEYLAENTQGGLLAAVLEADKILFSVLEDLGYPGETSEIKLTIARRLFSDFKRLKNAHTISEKIRDEIDFSLDAKLAEETLAVYYEALLDIKEYPKPRFSWTHKISFYFQKKIPGTKKILKWLIGSCVLFFLLVLFLDKTKIGNKIIETILKVTDFIFSWLLVLGLLGIGIVATVFGSLWYFKGRKKMDIDISS